MVIGQVCIATALLSEIPIHPCLLFVHLFFVVFVAVRFSTIFKFVGSWVDSSVG